MADLAHEIDVKERRNFVIPIFRILDKEFSWFLC